MEFNREKIKERVKELKAFLPFNIRKKLLELHPEYNTKQGYDLLDNVLKGKSADYRIMEILEKIVQQNQPTA
jgi:hypothetical protein